MENKTEKIPNKNISINPEQGLIQLLYDVGQIVQSNRIKRAEAKKRGETFNIFEILGLQTKETTLHSSFIASLLNPDGSHGLSYKPLEVFLRKLKDEGILKFEIDFSQVNIEIEYSIGNLTSDYSEGGRMDILLNDGKNFIGIENKIDAGDQNAQMVRYHNFLTKKTKEKGEFLLIYLSKFGSSPGEDSINCPDLGMQLESRKDFYVISYKDFIFNWLEECRHFAIDKVKVREIITQYHETIKNITGMNYTEQEKEKLFEILKQNIPAVNSIIRNGDEFWNYLFKEKIEGPIKEWAKLNNLKCIEGAKLYDGERGAFGLSFYKKDWNTKMIRIEYTKRDLLGFSETLIGICWKEVKRKEDKSKIIKDYKLHSEVFPNGYKYLEMYRNINIKDLGDSSRVNLILDHYKKQILHILEDIEMKPQQFNM